MPNWTSLSQHRITRAFRRRCLARHRHSQSHAASHRGNSSRRLQSRHFHVKLLIQLRGLGARAFRALHLIAQLNTFEMLPGVDQQAGRNCAGGRHALPEILHARGIDRTDQPRIVYLFNCEVFGHDHAWGAAFPPSPSFRVRAFLRSGNADCSRFPHLRAE